MVMWRAPGGEEDEPGLGREVVLAVRTLGMSDEEVREFEDEKEEGGRCPS